MAASGSDNRSSRASSRGKSSTEDTVSIARAALSDAATDDDELGFEPYVSALTTFLASQMTKTPLTLSVEGEWGAGKSSFMLQVEKLLSRVITKSSSRDLVLRYNAWRSDSTEAVWASFALFLIRNLGAARNPLLRVFLDLRLVLSRFDWVAGRLRFAQVIILWAALVTAAVFYNLWLPQLLALKLYAQVIGFGTLITLLTTALAQTAKMAANPLAKDLARFIEAPDYRQRRAFADVVNDDIGRIIATYVGKNRRVYVFIDDIDRCEVPKAADLMQALKILTSVEASPFIFIVGLDRDMVAASIAAKYSATLPFVRPFNPGAFSQYRAGLDFGYDFLEKFIQVPFRVPRPDDQQLKRFIETLSDPAEAKSTLGSPVLDYEHLVSLDISFGLESTEFLQAVKDASPLLGMNPRRTKQFINLFRLMAFIASDTDAFDKHLTLRTLAAFCALTIRWPRLIGDLHGDAKMLGAIEAAVKQKEPGSSDDPVFDYWHEMLKESIEYLGSKGISFDGVPVARILNTAPRQRASVLEDELDRLEKRGRFSDADQLPYNRYGEAPNWGAGVRTLLGFRRRNTKEAMFEAGKDAR